MNRINLIEFGQNLGTRELGIFISEYIDFSCPENIILDFENVTVVTSSFADELIGKNVKEIGLEEFIKKIKIENATDNIKLVIKKAMMDRLLEVA